MVRYVCSICGHEYDTEKGEPRLDIPPGIDLPALPDEFQCCVCFGSKDKFCREG